MRSRRLIAAVVFWLNLKDGAARPIGTLNGLARQLGFQLVPTAAVRAIGNDMHAFAPRESARGLTELILKGCRDY
jgi:hypothetical protein